MRVPVASSEPLAAPAHLISPIWLRSALIAGCDPAEMHPDEAAAVSKHWVASRRQEFAAGRVCASRGMEALGMTILPIGIAADRSPIWPHGTVGSISHSRTIAAAALARRASGYQAIGLDIEEVLPLDTELFQEVCVTEELAWLERQPAPRRGLLAKAIFCVKEAAYKGQYPISQRLFGFHALRVTLDLGSLRFCARFLEDASPFAAGDRLNGWIWISNHHFVAMVALR